MGRRSLTRWQHRLQREHPTCTEWMKSLSPECGWKGGDSQRANWVLTDYCWFHSSRGIESDFKRFVGCLSFPRNGNRSVLALKGSLRRETHAPLTAPGRSEPLSAMKEREALGKAKSKSHLTETGLLMEGEFRYFHPPSQAECASR